MGLLDASFRLLVAVVLGGLLGWDRERIGKPAGLRTHMMVTLGAALFVLLGVELLMEYSARVEDAQLDPTRVLQGVVGGIGFLGAGSIIQSRGGVEGVTTAASVWVTGAIGAGCGLGYYSLAAIVAGVSLVTLNIVARLTPGDQEKNKGKSGDSQ